MTDNVADLLADDDVDKAAPVLTKKKGGPVTHDKNGRPFRCESCGKPRLKGTQLCAACNQKMIAERGFSARS
jgi:hypothetical protein